MAYLVLAGLLGVVAFEIIRQEYNVWKRVHGGGR